MTIRLYDWLPQDLVQILIVLFLSFLLGLEREEHKGSTGQFVFGGVRTFPLIGLIGFAMSYLSGTQLLPLALGFVAVSAFLLLSYWHKLSSGRLAGVTSEMSGLTTYLIGALVQHNHLWAATTLCVASMLLLEFKTALEVLAKRVAPDDIITLTKFLLLTAVILPLLPNREFGAFQINPFKTWLVVVAVSGVSYGSYVLQRLTASGGVVLAAVLGGAYSSTVTTVALARRATGEQAPPLFSGAILMASGVMYLRLVVLLGLFNRALMDALAEPFLILGGTAIAAGWLWTRRARRVSEAGGPARALHNPLELTAALLFALLFLAMLVATHLAAHYLGNGGVYTLAAIMGVTDVDPFIMGMTQAAGGVTLVPVAATAVLIAAASNNLIKGIYAYILAPREVGRPSFFLLLGLAVLGLLPLLF
jgi:uncharacterized membrane protein (DUF4010 family)